MHVCVCVYVRTYDECLFFCVFMCVYVYSPSFSLIHHSLSPSLSLSLSPSHHFSYLVSLALARLGPPVCGLSLCLALSHTLYFTHSLSLFLSLPLPLSRCLSLPLSLIHNTGERLTSSHNRPKRDAHTRAHQRLFAKHSHEKKLRGGGLRRRQRRESACACVSTKKNYLSTFTKKISKSSMCLFVSHVVGCVPGCGGGWVYLSHCGGCSERTYEAEKGFCAHIYRRALQIECCCFYEVAFT